MIGIGASALLSFAGDFGQCDGYVSRWRGRGAAMHLVARNPVGRKPASNTRLERPQMWRNYNCANLQLVVLSIVNE